MRTRLFPTLLGAGIALAVIVVLAHAAANDIETTAQLCAACHGQNGVPSDPKTVPIIWGQEPSYLFKQMRNYRNGERDNPIMSPIAKSLAEEDLRKIASYFADKSWPAQGATASPAPPPKGTRIEYTTTHTMSEAQPRLSSTTCSLMAGSPWGRNAWVPPATKRMDRSLGRT
jgi:cytochrome c553